MPVSSGNFSGAKRARRRKNPTKLKTQDRRSFNVSSYRYPNGTNAFKVQGWIGSVRVRRFFKTREEAEAARENLEIERVASLNEETVVTTTLSGAQCREAQVAFRLLEEAGRKKSLTFYVRFALERYLETELELTLGQAFDRYLAFKSWECEQEVLSGVQYRSIEIDVTRFVKFVGRSVPIGEVASSEIEQWLKAIKAGPRTWNNKRGLLDAFFNHCLREEWLALNPVRKIRKQRTKSKKAMADSLSPDGAAELMKFVEDYEGPYKGAHLKPGFMVTHFALALFAGIRPDVRDGEIGRFQPEHVNLETGVIHVFPRVSKTNERRTIHIAPNLREWLEKYPLDEYPHLPTRVDWHKRVIRRKLGLTHNVLRHSFITYLVARDRSVGDAALQAGNTEAIVRKHYLDLRTKSEAEAFWSIVPAVE